MNKQRSVKNLEQAQVLIYELEQTIRELYLENDYLSKIINGEESFLEYPSEEIDRDKYLL